MDLLDYDKDKKAAFTIPLPNGDYKMETFCPECGFDVPVDEDGCCVSCGATATGKAVDMLFKILSTEDV